MPNTGDFFFNALSGSQEPPTNAGQTVGLMGNAFSSANLAISGQLALAGSFYSGLELQSFGNAVRTLPSNLDISSPPECTGVWRSRPCRPVRRQG
jgi:hypothetical protein